MRLHEAKKLDDEIIKAKLVEELICASLVMVTQVHIWHWQTKSYAAHTALGNYYGFLQGEADLLAEIFMGGGATFTFRQHKEPTNFVSIADVKAQLENYKTALSKTETELMKDENAPFHSAGDTLLGIIKETDKLLYLLNLE